MTGSGLACAYNLAPAKGPSTLAAPRRRGGCAQTNRLSITFEGPGVTDGSVPVAAFVAALQGAQDAVRLMVAHLGDHERRAGRLPQWVIDHSGLRLMPNRAGTMVADLVLDPSPDASARSESYGARAFAAISDWDGTEDSTLPTAVADCFYKAADEFPNGVMLWIGDPGGGRRVHVKRRDRGVRSRHRGEKALLRGWLRGVNWAKRTALLHDVTGTEVRLRFDGALDDEMLRLATRYVEVRGTGRFNTRGEWTTVRVERLNEPRSSSEPFDLEAFLSEPNPKVFDPDEVVTLDLTDEEWESFSQAIREGREA